MRVSLAWLSEWIDLPGSTAELDESLTQAGLEIESVEVTGPDLSAFRVGCVLERSPHPNADRLSVCRVEIGAAEPVDVVCGAPNVAAGQSVAVALPGTTLPDGTRLKKSRIRGVTSFGMICSSHELGLGEDQEGILVLEGEPAPGTILSEVYPAGDTILDLAITPNRGDWASMLGVAREVRAGSGGILRLPETAPEEGGGETRAAVQVEIEDRDGCFAYTARIVTGVTVAPSPLWLRERLEGVGLRPINNIVDITNLVLLEFGQPLHAFDLATLRGARIRVRGANPGETLVTLDGEKRELSASDLVIADADRAIAVAGIMGGAETEVGEGTSNVLIESAHFHPSRIRRTARRLGLATDASYRFERGVDREGLGRAADRAAFLMAELAGGSVLRGRIEVKGVDPPVTETLELEPHRVNRLLGTDLSGSSMIELLARVDIVAEERSEGRLLCRIPSHRTDLHIPVDLTEEVARMHGYGRIEATMPTARLTGEVRAPRTRELEERSRDALVGCGLTEIMTFAALRGEVFDQLCLSPSDPRRKTVRISNPVVEGECHLRPLLLPSLLVALKRNLSRQADAVRLFEVSRVFHSQSDGELPGEPLHAAGVLIAAQQPGLWRERTASPLFFQAKGVVEQWLWGVGHAPGFRSGTEEPFLHPGAACEIEVGGQGVGFLGELHPEVVSGFELGVPCAVFEVDLTALAGLSAPDVKYRAVSPYPRVRRDLAVLLDRGRAVGEVLEAIGKTAGPHLTAAEVFDRYEGEGVPEGKVSLAFRLVFQRSDRTLTDAEVNKSIDRVVRLLAHRFGGELR